jgi:hypothetical protein
VSFFGNCKKAEAMKRIVQGFVIDLETNRVTCSSCRHDCRSAELEDGEVYTCFNKECKSRLEVIYDPKNDEWISGPIGFTCGAEEICGKLMDLLSQADFIPKSH